MFKIGKFIIENPIIPAPMCGIMDAPFRIAIANFGCPMLYTEMLSSNATLLNNKREYIVKGTKNINDKIPFVIQIAGNDPYIMSEAAKICEQLGADILDLNFGCPVKKVTNGYAGSALMKDIELSKKIISSVVRAIKIPVTIKMRLGWDENNLNAPLLSKISEEEGVSTITIHARTRNQMYDGMPNWTFVQKVKEKIKIPLIINGNIRTFEDIDQALLMSKADGVMIGRGLYGKPWLIQEMMNYYKTGEKKSFKPQKIWQETIYPHILNMIDHYDNHAIGFIVKHLHFYSKGMENNVKFKNKLTQNIKNINNIINISEEFFSNYN